MDFDQVILMNLQREINYLIIKRDLVCLPFVVKLLNDYLQLNNISEDDLKTLTKLSIKYR